MRPLLGVVLAGVGFIGGYVTRDTTVSALPAQTVVMTSALEGPAAAMSMPAAVTKPELVLQGVIQRDDQAFALILEPGAAKAKLFALGERLTNQAEVVKIDANQVELNDPDDGRSILRVAMADSGCASPTDAPLSVAETDAVAAEMSAAMLDHFMQQTTHIMSRSTPAAVAH